MASAMPTGLMGVLNSEAVIGDGLLNPAIPELPAVASYGSDQLARARRRSAKSC
jgi:hypothetical protein